MELVDVLRYVASVSLAVCGAVALVVEFRDSATRRVTRTGAWMLAALIVCGAVLIMIQASTDATDRQRRLSDQRSSERDRRQIETLRQQLARVELPWDSIRVSYTLRADDDRDGQLHAYLARIRRHILAYSKRLPFNERIPGVAGGVWGSQYFICPGSPLFPTEESEWEVRRFARSDYFPIKVYKKPIDGARHTWAADGSPDPPPDLSYFVNRIRPRPAGCPFCGCVYAMRGFDALYVGDTINIKREEFSGSGAIVSVVDFVGSQMLIELPPHVPFPRKPQSRPGMFYVRAFTPTIERLSLKIGPLGEIILPVTTFKPPSGSYIHELRFPDTLEAMVEIGSR